MKKFLNVKLVLLAVLVLGLTTINVSATTGGAHRSTKGEYFNIPRGNDNFIKGHHHGNNNGVRRPKPVPTVGTPIDGGLVALLIIGGLGFLAIRKKKLVQI